MQHAIGDHALLADGRTAALVDPAGNVAFLCWPRIDSTPCLFSLLDEPRGGTFALLPVSPEARLISRAYHRGTLVLETVWQVGSVRLIVDDALAWRGVPRMVRRLRSEGGAVDVEVRFAPAFDLARAATTWEFTAGRARAAGGALALQVTSPGAWTVRDGVASAKFTVPAHGAAFVTLHGDNGSDATAGDTDPILETIAAWRAMIPGPGSQRASDPAIDRLLATSATVLVGLRQRGGGIVAAPTTSLPQWPGSARTWDYRYCWLRDASLSALALLRLGLGEAAAELGEFLGSLIKDGGPRALVRVDGSAAPEEAIHAELSGYRGARPVRIGNAAARQTQVDVAGEVIELAHELDGAGLLPSPLAGAVEVLADWLTEHWAEPDHGIWEIRGTPRRYTHSRVMAANGLRWAAALARRNRVRGDAAALDAAAPTIHDAVIRGVGALELHDRGGGADAALAMVGITGFLPPNHAVVHATIDHITARLDHDGLIDRYEGQADELPDPCAPFIFPTFWMSTAQAAAGRDPARWFSAACATCGSLGLWGEVAHPEDHTPLGNYPQVQSHAAFVLAATHR